MRQKIVRQKKGASRSDSAGGMAIFRSLRLVAAMWDKRVLWLLLALLAAAAAQRGWMQIKSVPVGPIEMFGYTGVEYSVRGATEEEIYLLMDEYLEQGFWDINLTRLQAVIESHRWIRRASVVRKWPNILKVRIDEHLPVARWNGTHLLASSAELIPVSAMQEFIALPQFTTPGLFSHSRDDIKLMVDRYNSLQKMLSPHRQSIQQLGSAVGSDIYLVLLDGTRVELGDKNHMQRLGRLINLVDGVVIKNWQQIAVADLRYAHGVSIEWAILPTQDVDAAPRPLGRRAAFAGSTSVEWIAVAKSIRNWVDTKFKAGVRLMKIDGVKYA